MKVLGAVIVIQLLLKSDGAENNVCATFKDYYTLKDNPNCWYDLTADSTTPEIIVKSGYPMEEYKVTTPDGYILTIFRIPNHGGGSKRGPVFLQHGWHGSSSNYVAHGKDSLAFILADAGYDVWLGNSRGNEYSEEHVNLTVRDEAYWIYTVEDIGLLDIPTMLDFVAGRTGQRGNIVYFGHSMGTTVSLVYSSRLTEHAKKTVKLFVLLAPAAAVPNVKSLFFRWLGPIGDLLVKIARANGLLPLLSRGKTVKAILRSICAGSPSRMQFCFDLLNFSFSGLPTRTEPSKMPVLLNQVPAGVSFYLFSQAREMIMGYFGYYGTESKLKYGSDSPPEHNLTKIEVPVYLIYGASDILATEEDTLILYSKLSSKARRYGLHKVDVSDFNHLDFLIGRGVRSILHDKILQLLYKI